MRTVIVVVWDDGFCLPVFKMSRNEHLDKLRYVRSVSLTSGRYSEGVG